MAKRLWAALPQEYWTSTCCFTDECKAYERVLSLSAHGPSAKGSGQINIVEAINCSLGQKGAALVRKTCSFSRSLVMYRVRIQPVIDEHNRRKGPNHYRALFYHYPC